VVIVLASGVMAQADSISILNPSFESPTPLADDDTNAGLHATPTSWTKVSANDVGMFDLSQTDGPGLHVSSIPDGIQALWGNSDAVDTNAVYQVLGTTLQANTTYTLTAYAGARSDLSFVQYGGKTPGTIELGYGTTYGANRLTAATSDCDVPANGTWDLWTRTFTTDASPAGLGQPLRVEVNINAVQQLFDNVQLSAIATPEPGTCVLTTLGLFGLLAYAWRRRR
jgi:hypothetical protein